MTGQRMKTLANTCGVLMVIMLGLLFLETSARDPYPAPYMIGFFGFGGLMVLFMRRVK